MPLVVVTLKNDMLTAFSTMTDDSVFADKISAAIKKYAENGIITTIDVGAISAGAFSGVGTGNLTCESAICKTIIEATCEAMKNMKEGGNEYLAAQLAQGIHAMVSAGQVKTDITGMVIPPSSSPVPIAGKGTGKMIGVFATMQAQFLAIFKAMDGMTSGGDEYMAAQMATIVDVYLKTAVVNTQGSAALSGSIGTGTMM
jgi:hypothetical protein